MKSNHTHIVFILDRSGSMEAIAKELRGDFSGLLKNSIDPYFPIDGTRLFS